MNLDFSQVIIQIIAFLVMLWVLKKFGWKPLLNLLHERQAKIQGEFDTIAAQKDDLRKAMEDYNEKMKGIEAEARRQIQEAVMQGRKIAMEIQEETQSNAKAILAKAREEVNEEIAKARNQLKNDMVNMAIAGAEKILQENIDKTKHKKLFADFVKEADLE
jgi:F-type H+-transporting ATPase subunit b